MNVKDLALEIGRRLNPYLEEILRDLGYSVPQHHEVKATLGAGHNSDLEFRPVEIRGEPLSTTILRERR